LTSGAPPRSRPARELGLAALFFLAITVLMTWPQAAHLDDALSDVGDAKLNARILQWDYAQTLRDPLHLYQLNFFYPAKLVLAFSENLYGVALFGFPLLAAGASALVNYNVLLLLGMFLSALAAWALAREVTGDPIASAVAGLVFAFLPWRFSQLPHMQFQWAGFLCLLLLFLLRYLDRGGTRDLVAYGICFAWNALCNVHYALFSGLLVGVTLVLFVVGGTEQGRRRWKWALVATLLGGLVFVPFALPYREASRLYGMRRYFGEMRFFSARWFYFLSAGERNWLYGHATEAWRGPEGDLFPGLLAVALAGAAVVQLFRAGAPRNAGERPIVSASRRRLVRALDAAILLLAGVWIWSLVREGLRVGPLHLGDAGRIFVFLTVAVAARLTAAFPVWAKSADLADFVRRARLGWRAILLLAIGAVGIVVALGGNSPYYRLLFQSFGELFRAIRAPSRGIVLFHLALAVLAAWGLALLLRGRGKGRRLAWTGAAVLVLVVEYRAFPLRLEPTAAAAPPVYAWLASLEMPGAVVEWPFGLFHDFDYIFRQAAHGKPILNGYSGFFPTTYTGLEAQLKQRPIPDSVWETMGNLGASMLVYHAHDGSGFRVIAYADAIDRALAEGRLELVRSFPHGKGLDFALISPATSWPERARRGAAAPEETRRLYAATVADMHRNVGRLAPPFGAIHLPTEGQKVAPGFWVHGWALDDSGIAEVRFALESGQVGVALPGGPWPGVAETFPDYPEARTGGTYGFALPEAAEGPHTLTVTLVARDGGVTTLRRNVSVVRRAPASPTPKGPGS
jgi:hypothetical protein